MSPKSELEQAEVPQVPQQFGAARRMNRSQNPPRAIGATPYISQNPATTSATPSMIIMAQQLIASIATSTEGVQTETVRMTETISARQDLLRNHLEQVPEQVAIVAGLRNKTIWTRRETHTLEEAEEIASLKAQLSCVECNACDLKIVAEHEHNVAREVVREGRQFFACIEDRARGFSQEEATTARETCDYELTLNRKADARRQQEHFSQVQQTLRTSNEEDIILRDQYQYEFRTELDSVKKELHMFQEANADNASEQ
eukprot:6349663-Amphidinium_carterae.1